LNFKCTFIRRFCASSEKISEPETEVPFEKLKMISPLKNEIKPSDI